MANKKRKGPPPSAKPQLTSLVDVLTILVVFLLKNFSAEGEIVTMSKNLELPPSSSVIQPERTLVVGISKQHILADGQPVAIVAEEEKRREAQIPNLSRWLEVKRKNTEQISNYDDNVTFDGKVTIQGDRLIPYWLLQKVMSTCAEKGYSDFSLAVLQNK